MTERVTGIGGVFFRARDPKALAAWYAEHLGVPVGDGYAIFPGEPQHGLVAVRGGHRLLAGGQAGDGQLHRDRPRRMLAQLRTAGVEIDERIEELDGIGRFGCAVDAEGNRIELWEPSGGRLSAPYAPASTRSRSPKS